LSFCLAARSSQDSMTPTMQREILPGTRPAGARDEREAGLRVRDMFARIAPRYDFLNHLLSFSLDRLWRRRTAKIFSAVLVRPEARLIDLCCGTGDLAFALARRRTRLLGGTRTGVAFAGADALALPIGDGTFDLVTAAFGLRNLSSYESGLREFARILKPGG